MVVTGDDDIDPVLDEDWLEQHTQVDRRPVAAGIRVQRMMEVANLPILARVAQRRVNPGQLLRIQLRAVEGEEPDIPVRIRVIALTIHVEWLVRDVLWPVVVAE